MYTKLEISIRYTCKPAYNRLCKSCGTIDYECDICDWICKNPALPAFHEN